MTNIAPNIFSGSAVVTNIHWSCAGQRIPPYEGDSGFFRLGTRQDSDGDGVSDGAEVSQGSDPNDINDGGVAPDSEDFVDLPFHIYGDWAAWRMNVEGQTGDGRAFRFHTDAPGASETRTLRLLRSHSPASSSARGRKDSPRRHRRRFAEGAGPLCLQGVQSAEGCEIGASWTR